MDEIHFRTLLALARTGLAACAASAPSQKLHEATAALIAGEGYLVSLQSNGGKTAPDSITPAK